MKAVVYDAPRSFEVKQVPTPRAGPGQVRIKIGQVGVCGTDLHIHDGDYPAAYPLIPGHEVVGVVDELGEGVTGLKVAEQVSVNPNVYCGSCDYCLSGRLILCANAQALGVSRPGFFAEFVVAERTLVFSVEGIHEDTAVFTEPASCAMHSVETLALRPGGSVLVLGAGPSGLLLAQLIACSGASSVTVAAPTQFKLDTATALCIDSTVLIERGDEDGNVAKLRNASPSGDGYDAVVEATGSAAVGAMCVPLTRNGGTVLVYGVARPDEVIAVHPFDIFRREITIKGSFAEMTSFSAAIASLRTGRVRTEGMITHRFALEDYGRALETVASDPMAHKVVIVC